MSSDNPQNQIAVVEKAAIAQELSSLLKSRKAIVPFPEKRVPYGWSSGNQQIAFFDLNNYQAIEEYCPLDQVITVQCGIKLHALEQFLIQNNQWLPVAYPDGETSLLDVILTSNAGPAEIFVGGLRRHILGLTFVLSNGVFAKSGGKVVKNVSGYDLTRFLIGSYGHFAVPIQANLRLYALPELTCTMVAMGNNIVHLLATAKSILSGNISLVYMDLFDKRLLPEQSSELISELIMDKTTMVAGHGYCLCAQIYGDQVTVESETAAVKKLLTEANLDHIMVTEISKQKNLLTELTQIDTCHSPKIKHGQIVELAAGVGDFIRLCQNKDLTTFPFLYRPRSGRLLYCLNSAPDQNLLLALLADYAKKDSKPLTVAYSDDVHMRKIITLGIDTTGGAESMKTIKRRLKEQFDPHNLFNPFVDL